MSYGPKDLLVNPEEGATGLDTDPYEYLINLKYSTEKSVYRMIVTDYFKNDPYAGVSKFLGMVIQETSLAVGASESSYDELEASNFLKVHQKCKVRIFDIHLYLPVPNFQRNKKIDKTITNLYPTCTYDTINNIKLVKGDFVEISFRNLKTKTGPYILSKHPLNESYQSMVKLPGTEVTIREAFQIGKSSYDPEKTVKANIAGIRQRAKPYVAKLREYCNEIGVEFALMSAIGAIETGFTPGLVSKAGAGGLMQIMPGTFNELSKRSEFIRKFPQDTNPVYDTKIAEQNMYMAVLYYKSIYDRYRDPTRAAAGYNTGPDRPHIKDTDKWNQFTLDSNINGENKKYIKDFPAYVKEFRANPLKEN